MAVLGRVDSIAGGPHVDLFDGGKRVGSVWPALPPSGGWLAVCGCWSWRRDVADKDGAIAVTERHYAREHGGAR